MPVETIDKSPEVAVKPEYTAKSFEMVFSKFCSKYSENLDSFTGRTKKDGSDSRFMGLHPDASVQQMTARLAEVSQVMGDEPEWEGGYEEVVDMRDAVLFSARYLAWHSTKGAITSQYLKSLDSHIESARHKKWSNGGSHQNINRLYHDRKVALAISLGQNHALRDYFDSGLARTLGNDSPLGMSHLLEHVPYSTNHDSEALVAGMSLEIASKRYIEQMLASGNYGDARTAYGSDEQDSRAGDIVVVAGDEILFIDIKSSMPEKFADGSIAQPEDFALGYKWLDSQDEELKVVVWAHSNRPVKATGFSLDDERLVQSFEQVMSAVELD